MDAWLKSNDYDFRENYVVAHLQWIANHKDFIPKEQNVFSENYTYKDIMKELYHDRANDVNLNRMAFANYTLDKAWLIKTRKIETTVNKAVEKLESTPNGMWFVTIGFTHQTWNVNDCCKAIEKLLGMEWIISGKANFELYRENGEHPHVHFIIETKEPKSRILDKIFRPQYVKKVVLQKNYIDVKEMSNYHLKYINLDKQESKMKFVEMDKLWRIKENIPDFEKNWKYLEDSN